MVFEGLDKLIAAFGAALAALLTPLGVIYAANLNRQSKSAESSVSVLTLEVERLEVRLDKAGKAAHYERQSGLRWYQVAIYWFNLAHDMRRNVLDARFEAENLARLNQQPPPKWNNPLTLPSLEDGVPKLEKYT